MQTTPSKRPKELLMMIDKPMFPELRMPKPGKEVATGEIQKINDNFETKCLHCFFMGRDFKFEVNISQCHLAPPEKCVRAKEDAYVEWIIAEMLAGQWKDDMQTLVVMPQGLKRMSTSEMWPTILKGDLWLIDGQHNVEAAKKIQLMIDGVSPNQKKKYKMWNALVVWSDNETILNDISVSSTWVIRRRFISRHE